MPLLPRKASGNIPWRETVIKATETCQLVLLLAGVKPALG